MAVVVKDMEGNMETLENGFHVDVQEIFSSSHSD